MESVDRRSVTCVAAMHMNVDSIESAVQAALQKIENIIKCVFLSQQMQTSLETYAAAYTIENRNAKISDFNRSIGSGSVKQQPQFLWFKEFQSARKKRTKPGVARAPEARGQEVSTADAKAMSFVEADILSSPRHVPAGTSVILSENVRQFQKRSARIDRHMKIAKRNLAKIKKSLYIESDCDDTSSSEEKR